MFNNQCTQLAFLNKIYSFIFLSEFSPTVSIEFSPTVIQLAFWNKINFNFYFYFRVFTYNYLYVFNSLLLIFPMTLCYDWQVFSLPLVESVADHRNLATVIFYMVILLIVYRCYINFISQVIDFDICYWIDFNKIFWMK